MVFAWGLMNTRLTNRLVDIAQGIEIEKQINKRTRHYAFILNKSKIISIGRNKLKSHPKILKYKYPENATIHAELSAIIKSDSLSHKNNKLITFRFDKSGELNNGKPCKYCQRLLSSVGFKQVWYSNSRGKFVQL